MNTTPRKLHLLLPPSILPLPLPQSSHPPFIYLSSRSEKARIPAWCDRILRKGDNLRQIQYTTAPLRFSDHRPVYATFECTVGIIDEPLKESLSRELYDKRRAELGTGCGTGVSFSGARPSSDFDDDELAGYESIAPSLPAASSDRKKWWLNNGRSLTLSLRSTSINSLPQASPPAPPSPKPKPATASSPTLTVPPTPSPPAANPTGSS